MAALIVVLAIATSQYGERIGINSGQGWDGETYVAWVAHFKLHLVERGTDAYHAQRVLPSGILHLVMRALHLRGTVPQMVEMFYWFDAAMLVLAAILWSHLGELMRWRPISVWVGFAGMFGSFALARHALYSPALTDTAAFALGMAVTWAYLARRPIVLWLCTGLAMFTWPGLVPVGAACLVLPRLSAPLPAPDARWSRRIHIAALVVACGLTLWFLLVAHHYLVHPSNRLGIAKFADWVRRDWLPITLPLLAAMLVFGCYSVVHHPPLWNVRAYVRTLHRRSVVLALAGLAVLVVLRQLWLHVSVTQTDGPTFGQFICQQTLEALRGPVWGPVHHVVYFGPVFALAALEWRRIIAVVASWGYAAVATFGMLVMFAVASESRQWIHLLPFLIAATIAATDARWTPRGAAVFVTLVLAWSKLWFRIGYTKAGDWLAFPAQRYFMQMGPWASDRAWVWHGAAALVTMAVLWLVLRSSTGEHRAASPAR